MKRNIVVEIGYKDFIFTDLAEAVQFADIASRTSDKPEDIQIVVTYKEDKDNE